MIRRPHYHIIPHKERPAMKRTSLAKIVTVPNCITAARIVGTVFLIFLAPLSLAFYIVYTLCGLTDLLDGWIARSTNNITEFGSKLDSIADLFFYIVMMLKIIRILWRLLPLWIWYVLGAVLLLRVVCYITAAIKFRCFTSLHTRLNKICGISVFLLPYFLALPCAVAYCIAACLFGGVAACYELTLHLCRKEYIPNHKGLF